jgi:hypothetical protein
MAATRRSQDDTWDFFMLYDKFAGQRWFAPFAEQWKWFSVFMWHVASLSFIFFMLCLLCAKPRDGQRLTSVRGPSGARNSLYVKLLLMAELVLILIETQCDTELYFADPVEGANVQREQIEVNAETYSQYARLIATVLEFGINLLQLMAMHSFYDFRTRVKLTVITRRGKRKELFKYSRMNPTLRLQSMKNTSTSPNI